MCINKARGRTYFAHSFDRKRQSSFHRDEDSSSALRKDSLHDTRCHLHVVRPRLDVQHEVARGVLEGAQHQQRQRLLANRNAENRFERDGASAEHPALLVLVRRVKLQDGLHA
jgi:hypothetical protein